MNKRIEQYTIIEASFTDSLIDLVQDFIQNNGWQPLGSVSYVEVFNNIDRVECRFYQAMVKYERSV